MPAVAATCLLVALLHLGAPPTSGETINIQLERRLDFIELPFFDTSLGVLTGVDVRYMLESGFTSSVGNHSHTLAGVIFGGTTTSAGSHTHTITLPSYSGGGLTERPVPDPIPTAAAGGHTHSVDFGASSTSAAGSHSHTYPSRFNFVSYGDTYNLAFLKGSNFSLNAVGPIGGSSAGGHSHQFGLLTTSTAGSHSHTILPRWSTSTFFNYDPFTGSPGVYGWDGEAADNLWESAANWRDGDGQNGVPDGNDILLFAEDSAIGPQTIGVGGITRQIHRIEANGVDTSGGPYTFENGTLEIFLPGGNAILSESGGGAMQFDTDILFYIPNAPLRFNVAPGGGAITVNGDVSPSATAGTTELVLTSRNLELDSSVTIAGDIADGPGSMLALTAGFGPDSENHRGVVTVTGNNTYSGSTVVNGAVLVFDSIDDAGDISPTALGSPPPENATIRLGAVDSSSGAQIPGTLRYVGTGDSTDRPIHLADGGGGVIASSGSGPLVFTAPQFTTTPGSKTLTLGGKNTAANEIQSDIPDAPAPAQGAGGDGGGGGGLTVKKSGSGRWFLSGSNTYTGDTIVEGGTLSISSAYLADTSNVFIADGAFFDLMFDGANDINFLYLAGQPVAPGLYGSANSMGRITGTGMLNVLSEGPPLGVDGDYNDDGIVNAADYIVWRNNLDTDAVLPNDTSPGTVTQQDYEVWVANFGNTAADSLLPATPVPEPAAVMLLIVPLAVRRWRGARLPG